MEGSIVNVPPQGGRKHPDQQYIKINTTNILFICGGAFSGINNIINSRVGKLPLGFSRKEAQQKKSNTLHYILPQDVKKYGLIPELIGRLPVLTSLEPLNQDILLKILIEPKNSIIKQYEKLFKMDNCSLSIDPKVYDLIVEYAYNFKLGARGLRSICEKLFLDKLYTSPGSTDQRSKKIKIDLKYAHNALKGIELNKLREAS